MPTDNFDRAVRARMADTGEPYQTARNALIAADHELVADAAVGLLATVEDHDPTMRVRILTRPGGLARVAVALPHLLDRVHEATWGEWDRGVAHNAVEADDHESVDLIWPAVEVEAWADYLTHGLHALTPRPVGVVGIAVAVGIDYGFGFEGEFGFGEPIGTAPTVDTPDPTDNWKRVVLWADVRDGWGIAAEQHGQVRRLTDPGVHLTSVAAPLRRWAGHDGVPVSSPMFNGMPVRAQVRTDGDHVIVDWAEDPVGVPATDGMWACDYGVTHPSGPDTDSACPDCAMVFRVIGQWWKEQTYAVRVNGTAVYARSLLSTVAAMHDRPLLVGGEAGNVLDTVTAAPAGDGLPHLRLLEWWRHNGDAPVVGAVTDGDETICGLPVGQPVDAAAAGRMCSRCDEGLDRVQFSVRDSNDPPELPSPGPVHRIDRPPIGIVLGQPTGRTEGRLVDVLDTRVLIPDPARQTITATTPDAVTVLHTCQPGDTRDRGCIACATPGRGAAWLREVEHRWDTTAGGEYPHWQAPDGTTAWTLTDDSVSTQLFDDAAVARVLTGPRTVRIAAAVTPRRPGRLHAMALDRIVGIDAHTHASVAVRPFDILWTRAVCGGEAAPAQARGEGLCKRCGDRVRRMRRDGIVVEFGGHDHDPDGDDGRRLAELLDRVG